MFVIAFGTLGLIVGSFLNVLIARHGIRGIGGRSKCMSCSTQLLWYDMIPVVSWFVLRGECRMCNARISLQYPLVELSTGILFAFIAASPLPFGLIYRLLFCLILALLVAIFVYDLRHTIIPDLWVYFFDASALVVAVPHLAILTPYSQSVWPLLLAGPIAASPLFALWFFSRGAWMGFGDVKLALGIGWLLGPWLGPAAIVFAFIIGGVVSGPLLLLSSELWKRTVARFTPTVGSHSAVWGFTMKSEIPFGPFLICSCIILWFSALYGLNPLALLLPSA